MQPSAGKGWPLLHLYTIRKRHSTCWKQGEALRVFDNKVISCAQRTPVDTRVGIDTLKMRLRQYVIRDDAALRVEQPPLVAGRSMPGYDLYETTTGRVVRGTEATARCAGGAWELSIKPGYEGIYARVLVHVPQLCFGHNLEAATYGDLINGIRAVERELSLIGVSCDLCAAYLSRVDIGRNVILSAPFLAYQPVLKVLTPRGNMKPEPYFDGILWKNKSTEEFAAYDKQQAARKRKQPWDPAWGHVARLETRLLGLPKIRSVLGAATVAGLCGRYVLLPDIFRRQMRRHLFRGDMPALPDACAVDSEALGGFFETYRQSDMKRGSDIRALATIGLAVLQERGLTTQEVQSHMATASSRRWVAAQFRVAAGARLEPVTSRPYADLYEELREKTLA